MRHFEKSTKTWCRKSGQKIIPEIAVIYLHVQCQLQGGDDITVTKTSDRTTF